MITLLSKIFIKDEFDDNKKRSMLGILCGALGIFLNIILFAFKFFAGMISGAVSIMADAFNNLSDAGSSIVTLLGFKLAGQKADREHPYGHGRMEYISGFIVSSIIIVMGFELMKESVTKIFKPEQVDFSITAVLVLVAAILVKCYMAFYNNSVGNKIESTAVKATAADSLSDCIATSVVLASMLIGYFTGFNLDGYAGVIVSLFIFYAGYSSAKDSLDPLLGNPPEPEFILEIENIVMNFDENIVGLHDLMVHDYGPGRRIISLHAEVPDDKNINDLHDVVDNLEYTLEEKLGCVTTIHMDPVNTTDERVVELKKQVITIVKSIHDGISIHDFRVVWGNSHTNLIFDMAVPFECKKSDEEVMKEAQTKIYETIGNHDYFAVVKVDRDNYILK